MKKTLTFFFLFAISFKIFSMPLDSIGVERKGNKTYVIHQVELSQTLYSILKKYKCSQADFLLANPTVKDPTKIGYGQILKVPISGGNQASAPTPSIYNQQVTSNQPKSDMVIMDIIDTTNFAKPKATTNPNVVNVPVLTHKVATGETLLSVAKKYGVTMEQIRVLNNLKSDKLLIGQSLIIKKGTPVNKTQITPKPEVIPQPTVVTPSNPVITEQKEVKKDSVAPKPPISASSPSKEEKKEAEKKMMPKELKLGLGIDGDFRQGNIQRNLLKARGFLEYEHPKSIFGINTNPKWAYGTFKGLKNEDELFLDLNTTLFAYQKKLYYLAFGIYEESNLRKINSRLLGSVGLSYRILGSKNNPKTRFKLAITSAIIYEKTDYRTRPDIELIRSSSRIKFSGELIKNKLYLNNMTFLQPALNQNNFRWNAITQLSVKISKAMAMNLNFENSYESVVPDGLKNTDMALTFGINYNGRIGL